jgi:hypothetical protein
VPVRVAIEDLITDELRWYIAKGNVIDAEGDHEIGITKFAAHHITDGQLLFHARLAEVLAEHDDLLGGFVSENVLNLIPEIGTAGAACACR